MSGVKPQAQRVRTLTLLAIPLIAYVFGGCDATSERNATSTQRVSTTVTASPDTSDPAADTIDVPDTIPDTTPDTTDTIPDTIPDAADTTADIPDTIPDTPADTTADIPDTTDTPADTTDTIPGTTDTPADTTDTIPGTTDATPTDTTADTTVPDTTDAGPATLAALGDPCQVGAEVGTCLELADCEPDETAVEGFCEGHPQVRCCLSAWDRCSAARRPGACLETTSCPAPHWESTSGLCPGPADVRCCTSTTPAPTCDPAVRPDPNHDLSEAPGDPGCPSGMVRLTRAASPSGGFCVDRFEASLVLDADPTQHHSPFHNPGSTAVRAVSLQNAVPQGYIDQVRAKAACERSDKRLCTSAEWLHACQGQALRTYPYGTTRVPGLCNDDRRQHVAVEFFPNDPNPFSKINNACLSQLPNSVDLNGENAACITPEGVHDLMGNLHEWIDDPAGTFRGGFYDDTTINGNGCLYRTTAHDVNHWDYSTGFRCCADLLP